MFQGTPLKRNNRIDFCRWAGARWGWELEGSGWGGWMERERVWGEITGIGRHGGPIWKPSVVEIFWNL